MSETVVETNTYETSVTRESPSCTTVMPLGNVALSPSAAASRISASAQVKTVSPLSGEKFFAATNDADEIESSQDSSVVPASPILIFPPSSKTALEISLPPFRSKTDPSETLIVAASDA